MLAKASRWRCLILMAALLSPTGGVADSPPGDVRAIAEDLALMLQAARSVISENQDLINDPNKGDKGLTGAVVVARALEEYRKAAGNDPPAGARGTRAAKLRSFQLDAIIEVMDTNQDMINARGVAFKAFIPAVFARLVNEAFHRRAGDEASVKVTAPPDLVRNRKSLPDALEGEVIRDRFLASGWPRGNVYETSVTRGEHREFRMLVPEYYSTSCLSCHGSPKGSLDITGYPREGASAGDLGGVISVTVAE